MKKIILLSLSILILTQIAQAQALEWAKQLGGTSNNNGYSIAVDDSGNVYTTGVFNGTVYFDPGDSTFNLTSTSGGDVFISKLDASGNFVWAKQLGGTNNSEGNSIAVDASGNVYTTGRFQGIMDFDPGANTFSLTSFGGSDVFISKLDASGNFVWAKQLRGTGNSSSHGRSIAVDASGNVYTTGRFQGTVDFDPGANTLNINSLGLLGSDVFISKLDASGNLVWTKQLGGTAGNVGFSIAIDTSGNVYTTGSFQGTVDFDPGANTFNLTSFGGSDIFISKLDASGNFVWAKQLGGTGGNVGYSIALDASGNVYTTGSFQGTVDFDPGANTFNLTSAGNNDVFISKLDASGNFAWAKQLEGSSNNDGRSIAVDNSGNAYTTGNFQGTVDFDPGTNTFNLSSAGNTDIFISKLDALGNFVGAKQLGGLGNNYGYSIASDASGNVYTTGYFQGTADFNPGSDTFNLTSGGNNDVFVHKMSACTNITGTDTRIECNSNSFTWIDGNTYTASNDTATYNILGGAANGCDSLVTLNLTFNHPTTGTDTRTECNSLTWIDGNTYTASNDTATHNIVGGAANGCDSLVTLDLTINSVSDITTTTTGVTITANSPTASYQWLDCNNNYAVISGETNQSFTPTVNGDYAVELSENGCVDTSACDSITTLGIIENNFDNEFTMYPNPTSGKVHIVFEKELSNTHIIVRNALGQKVYHNHYASTSQIDFTVESPAGIYFIEIQSNGEKAVLKLIKN